MEMKESIMEILLILTLVVLVFTITIPIIDTHKSYKKLKNTRKKLKDQQQERKICQLPLTEVSGLQTLI